MSKIADDPSDITPSLSFGLSIDHVVSVIGSAVCGYIWHSFGSQYVFMLAGIISAVNLWVEWRMKRKPS